MGAQFWLQQEIDRTRSEHLKRNRHAVNLGPADLSSPHADSLAPTRLRTPRTKANQIALMVGSVHALRLGS